MKQLLIGLLTLCCAQWITAQELNVDVKIFTPGLQNTDPKVFQTLQTDLQEYMNNQNWTDDGFEVEERINVNIQLTISEEEDENTFEGELSIQASRPVYNSSYETVTFSHRDVGIKFDYEQYQPLRYTESTYEDNISSLFAFYAYFILGMDYDSFEEFAGTPYFKKAEEILNVIPEGQKARYGGWQSVGGNRNRYWLVENILTSRIRPYRSAMYNYHRHGLDRMSEDPVAGRAIITEAIASLKEVNRSYPNSMIIQIFSNTKRNEILEIFKPARTDEQNKVIGTMTRIDAAQASKYNQIRKR
ncbi:MAG: DUF4835 family protein [Bacteroidota bacterium]